MIKLFAQKEYIIELKLASAFLEPLRDVYNVKDEYGNLLGYVKKQRLKIWPKFWFEGIDGTRLGEIHSSKKGDEIYDAQNQLLATIKEKPRSPTKKGNLGAILFIAGLTVAMLGFVLYLTSLLTSWLVIIFIGAAFAILGGYFLFSTMKKPEWLVEDYKGEQLAEIKEVGKFFAEYQVLTPDGSVIANINKKRGLSAFRHSYSIDIKSKILDPRFIISYTILRADMNKAASSATPMPVFII